MSLKIAFVELTVFSGVLPLASGYMEAYCRRDPLLATACQFEKHSLAVNTPYEQILQTLRQSDADVYAFSCYVWNAGLVRRLLAALLAAKPTAQFILGGPQVMHQGARYLDPQRENVFLCNGEGERTFYHFLRAIVTGERDFASVRGLSFCRDGQLVTTEPEPRISDLSEVPSPFLEGLFEKGRYTWLVFETNRGCPFKCNYCYWGAAIGAKVYKYDNERLERELAWISQSQCVYLFIADANWGMLPRDVELSKRLAENGKRYGSPMSVYFAGSKNTPERVAEITRIFHQAGMIATQSVALQTMSPRALALANRDNIKTSAYTALQTSLNQHGISSFVEMMWPLPGETLASFQEGLAKLCEIGADSFVVYPLLLMNNVELNQKREAFGLVTVPDSDPNGEAEVVVATNEVSREEFREGLRYVYAVTSLHVLRGLWSLARYLNGRGIMSYADLFRAFVKHAAQHPTHPYTRFCEESIRKSDYSKYENVGALVHLILHAERDRFDELLRGFVTRQDFWRDPAARFFFDVDLLNRPYIYRNTRIAPKRHQFELLRAVSVAADGYIVEVPQEYRASLREYLAVHGAEDTTRWEVKHRRSQLPYMPRKSLQEHYLYCQDASQKMGSLLPLWQAAARHGASPQA